MLSQEVGLLLCVGGKEMRAMFWTVPHFPLGPLLCTCWPASGSVSGNTVACTWGALVHAVLGRAQWGCVQRLKGNGASS